MFMLNLLWHWAVLFIIQYAWSMLKVVLFSHKPHFHYLDNCQLTLLFYLLSVVHMHV